MLQNLIKEFRANFANLSIKNSFVRNSFVLTIGTTIAQAIPVLLSPILARLFSPEEFGLLAIVSSITVIINVISTGKFETAIILTKNKREAANLVGISLTLSLLISLLALVIFFFFSDTLIRMLNQPKLEYWIFICPLISFLISIYQIYNEWCIRNAKFFNLSINKITNSTSITISNLIIGLSKVTSGGLIIGEIIGRFISAISSVISALKLDLSSFKQINLLYFYPLAKRYKSCPKYIMPGQLLNIVGSQLPIFIITRYFSEKDVGFYSLATMTLTVPVSIVSLAIRDVFKSKAREEYSLKKNCKTIYIRTFKSLFLISVLIFGVLFLITPKLFEFIFGSNWHTAGLFARVFCPMILVNFISESLTGMFFVANGMKKVLIWQIIYISFNIISLSVGVFFYDDILKVLIFFVTGRIIVDIISLNMTYNLAKGL